MIELKRVTKTFLQGQSKVHVLQGVDLKISEGTKVSIIGPSGGGKSTLLSIVAGIELPTEGSVYFGSQCLNSLSEDARANLRATHFGFIFQQFRLIPHLTALENVMLPLEILKDRSGKEDPIGKAKHLLGQVGLTERFHHLPSELSGGECQRVAIARALIHNPSVILGDEPSGNLDQETGRKVMGLMFDLISSFKKTLILVTHDQALARQSDVTYRLNEGKISIESS